MVCDGTQMENNSLSLADHYQLLTPERDWPSVSLLLKHKL